MNDPNGLSFVEPAGGGPPVYHLFYQANPCSTCANWAPKSCGVICEQWGHATSRDLVLWTHQPPSHNHSITGNSGAAVVLSPTLCTATGYVAVAFASGTMWGCRDEGLARWERAVGKSGAALFKLRGSPPGFGNFGDNNAWLDAAEDTVYYLVGGIRDGDVDAAALYRSTAPSLDAWELVTEWYSGSKADFKGIGTNCPDVWRNATGDSRTTVFMWLEHPPWHKPWVTAYTVGPQQNSSAAPRFAGRGLVDNSAAFIAAQSFTDAKGRRVIFAWVNTPTNPVFVGLQSFPRELWLDESTQRLHSRPIEELAVLMGVGVNSSAHFATRRTAPQTAPVAAVAGQHSFQLKLRLQLAEPPPDGAAAGARLFGGTSPAAGLSVALVQPACAAGSILAQSDLLGADLASLAPPSAVAANASEAARWCRAQCCARTTCHGWTSIHLLNASAALARCRLKGSGASVGTTGGGGCLAQTIGEPGAADGSGDWRCASGLRGLELHIDGGGPAVPVYPKPSGEIALNILADKMVAEVFVEDVRGEGAAAITAVFDGVCANCTGATLFAEGGAAVAIEAEAFVLTATSAGQAQRADAPVGVR